MAVVLQVDFSMPAEMLGEALSKSAVGLAESINQEPGFISKIWTENPNQRSRRYLSIYRQRLRRALLANAQTAHCLLRSYSG